MRRRVLATVLAEVVAISLTMLNATAPVLAAATCASSGPSSYTVTVCITAPNNGSTATGNVPVSATVTVTGTSPGIQRAEFLLDGGYLITDFSAPYSFQLPSPKWVDGNHSLAAHALMRDSTTSANATITLSFVNGVSSPPPQPTGFAPRNVAGSSAVVAAVGDGVDGSANAQAVGTQINSWNPNMLLYLGDVYEKGSTTEFANWYDGSPYGTLASKTNPAIGNHEYENGVAPGYFGYWKSPPHYYSATAGPWKVIALDSTSQFNQTASGTAQYNWLVGQLASSPPCTLVYFHHPVFSVGPQGGDPRMTAIWQLMVDSGVDLVLTGHDHSYQRWKPLDRNGVASATGVTQFVVGSGGHGIQAFVRTDSRMVKGFDTSPSGFGALRLTLNPSGASYAFTATNGTALDSGSVACSGVSADNQPPTKINDLTASAPLGSAVNLSWSPSQDNVGVSAYDIYRGGSFLTSTGGTSYSDTAVSPGNTYSYYVIARDAAGNSSPASNTATATTPADGGLVFLDTFETGTMGQWASVTGVAAQGGIGYGGSFGAHAVANNGTSWADTPLPQSQTNLYYRVRFNLASASPGQSTYLARLRNTSAASIIGLYVSSTGKLGYRNDVAGTSATSTLTVSTGAWHDVQLHVTIAGGSGQTEVWYDGTRVDSLSLTQNMGTTAVGRIQIGDNATPRTFDFVLDDVAAGLGFIGTAAPPDTTKPSTPGTLTATPISSSQVNLAWGASTDDVAVTAYDIYRGAIGDPLPLTQFLTSVGAGVTTYSDNSVGASTGYEYQVRARDAATNVSDPSNMAAATTPPPPADITKPTTPGTLTATAISSGQVNLGWGASSDNVAVTAYDIYRGIVGDPTPGVQLLTSVGGAATTYNDMSVAPSTSYEYQVTARDAAGNVSDPSNLASATTPAVVTGGTFTFTPVADSYVDASNATTNYGKGTTLRFDNSPKVVTYVRFTLTGVVGTVTKVTLRLYPTSTNSAGCSVSAVANNTWTETGITSSNAPPLGANLASCGGLSNGTWKDVDLTASGAVTGNGTYSFALTTSSSTSTALASRESANAPKLVVVTN